MDQWTFSFLRLAQSTRTAALLVKGGEGTVGGGLGTSTRMDSTGAVDGETCVLEWLPSNPPEIQKSIS